MRWSCGFAWVLDNCRVLNFWSHIRYRVAFFSHSGPVSPLYSIEDVSFMCFDKTGHGNDRSATRQATPQATPWRHFDKTGHGYAGRKIPTGRARKSRNEISVACNAIMSVQYVILYYTIGPTCRGPNGHVRASLEI